MDELSAREQAKTKAASTDDSKTVVPNHAEQIASLQTQLQQMILQTQSEKNDADDRIKSLEAKISNSQNDQMLGDPLGQTDDQEIEEAGPLVTIINQGMTGPKIGQIILPPFSGNLEEWESFKALYETVIHSSTKMNKTVKFNQLRTLLKGQALDAIRGYQLTGTNYDAAWEHLKKRYDRKDELIDEYIRKFFETKTLDTKTNYVAIRKIIDYTNQMLRALPNLGANIGHWDPIVNLIICSKLNEDLRSEWVRKKVTREISNETCDLLDFLEEKAIELQPKQSERFSEMLKGDTRKKHPQKKVFQTNESKPEPKKKNKNECLMCKGNHSIWDCNILKKESAKARSGIIKALGLCFKCLLKHRAGLCDNEECEYCGGPHHILLCFKKENEDKLKPIKSISSKRQPKPSTSNQVHSDWEEESPVKKNFKN